MSLTAKAGAYAGLFAFAVFAVFPLYWTITSSLRARNELFASPPALHPFFFDVVFYDRVFVNTPFGTMFFNSMFISLATTLLTVIVSAMAGHSLARMRFRGKMLITRGVLIAYILPQILLLVPLFVVIVRMGLANTFTGLILTYMTFSLPFGIWMLTAYFKTIPIDLEEAALLDGASRFQVFTRIVIPLSKPGLAAVGIFTFIHAWNEFLYALVLLSSEKKATLAVGIYRLLGSEAVDWGAVLAATTMMVLPVLVVFMVFERHLVGGLTAGATKG